MDCFNHLFNILGIDTAKFTYICTELFLFCFLNGCYFLTFDHFGLSPEIVLVKVTGDLALIRPGDNEGTNFHKLSYDFKLTTLDQCLPCFYFC